MRQIRFHIDRLLSVLIALLGFAGCSGTDAEEPEEPLCMYGVPTAKQIVDGSITDEQARPLESIRVIVNTDKQPDTTYTDAQGRFYNQTDIFPSDSVSIEIADPSGAYAPTAIKERLHYEGDGDGAWDMGTATAHIDITLRPIPPATDSQ